MKTKLTLLLLFISLLPAAAHDNLLARMERLRTQYHVNFLYDASLRGTLEAPRSLPDLPATLPLETALRQTFDGSGLTWQQRGRNVVLKAVPASQQTAPARRVTLSGHITDSASGETLIGAGVLSGRTGAATNEFGFYSLTLPAGRHRLQAAYLGYDQQVLELDLQRDTTLDFALRSNAELEAARIVSRRDAGVQSVYLGSLEVPIQQIKNTPTLLGEADVIKALQLLPGIQGGQEGLAGLHVRGGGPEENLVMLDGVPVYNMDHLLGLFSIFQPEAVKNVTLYKGSFPARYGGRISSIVDIRTNDGNMKETHGSLTVGVLNDRFHIEGPIVKDRLSYSFSARGLHSIVAEPLLRLFLKNEYYNYYFYDLNGKLTWHATPRDRFYLSLYQGADNGGYREDSHSETNVENEDENGRTYNETFFYDRKEELGFQWGSTLGALRWNHVFNNRLFANTTLSFNRYRMKAALSEHYEKTPEKTGTTYLEEYSGEYLSGIFDLSARIDFDWTPAPTHLVKFGAEYIHHDFRPETLTQFSISGDTRTEDDFLLGRSYLGGESSLYAEDNISLGTRITLNPGIRLTWFNTQNRNYLSLQPRLSAKVVADGGLSFKAGYSRMAQYIHLLSSTSIALPLDLWVPITQDIRPVTADHYSLGAYFDGLPGWEFSLEGYWKEMNNLLEYKEGVVFLVSSDGWEKQVVMGRGRSVGLEFYVQKTAGKATGGLAYTLAKSDRWFSDGSINMGRPFPYRYDRRHKVDLTFNYKFSEKVDLAASWIFCTGGTMTIPLRRTALIIPTFYGNGYSMIPADYTESRNNYRLPPTHRLNLGVNLRHATKRGNEVVWNLSLYNAYNAMNPQIILYRDDPIWGTDSGQGDEVSLFKLTVLPIIPAFSYTLNF